jgi:hypothetical protein
MKKGATCTILPNMFQPESFIVINYHKVTKETCGLKKALAAE